MTKTEPFYMVYKKDVLAFGLKGALLIALISEFEARNYRCWISRRQIGKKLDMSETTAQRLIERLVREGAISKVHEDGQRFLEVLPNRWDRFSFTESTVFVDVTLDNCDMSN